MRLIKLKIENEIEFKSYFQDEAEVFYVQSYQVLINNNLENKLIKVILLKDYPNTILTLKRFNATNEKYTYVFEKI